MKLKKLLSFGMAMALLLTICGCNSNASKSTSAKEEEEWVDFTVDVESGRDIRVLQLTDPQIIQSEQRRYPERIGEAHIIRWSASRSKENYQNYIRDAVEQYQPDLIVMTGDLVYGEFDDSGAALQELVSFMDSFKIPWAPVFGNHDNESVKGVDWQCEQFENSQYGLFKQRELTGNGNYTVGLRQDGVYKRVFFMLDSNGCGNMSIESYQNGHARNNAGFGDDQIEWYSSGATALKAKYPDIKLTACFHIQPFILVTAMAKYGYDLGITDPKDHPINLEKDGKDGDFGYIGSDVASPWDMDRTAWNAFKDSGFDSLLFGHEHCNSASVVYEGIRLQFGQKSSTYDCICWSKPDGTIENSFDAVGDPIVGGTAMDIAEADGSIVNPHIVLSSGKYK